MASSSLVLGRRDALRAPLARRRAPAPRRRRATSLASSPPPAPRRREFLTLAAGLLASAVIPTSAFALPPPRPAARGHS